MSSEPFVADGWHGGRCFDAQDARTWASLVVLSGGLLNLSDRIKGLNETGLGIIRTALEYAGGHAAVPLDMERSIPRVLLREEKSHYLLGLFNWDDEATVTVSATEAMGVVFPVSGRLDRADGSRDGGRNHGDFAAAPFLSFPVGEVVE